MKKRTGVILASIAAVLMLTACGKDEEASKKQPATATTEINQSTEKKSEEKKDGFPVPLYFNGKTVALSELDEAQQACAKYAYDYFNTAGTGIKTEQQFYEMIKNKYYIPIMPDKKIPKEIDTPKLLIANYGKFMLPAFNPEQLHTVKSLVFMPSIKQGVGIRVPMYVETKEEENMRGIAMSYDPVYKYVLGADEKFPVPNIEN